ncbi:PEP-CTERM sorting domain-containing protein [Rubripirellula amarantea]|nr:PEP-CTERM sorting domain-containing protein [Rubripirellula amarantea]
MFNKLSFATVLLAGALVTSSSSADLIYELDFNTETGTPGDYNPNFDQADPVGISARSYTAGTGMDGSRALQVDFNTTGDPFSVSYFTNLSSSSVNAPTSANASDYDLSFDVRIEGFDFDSTSVFTQFDLRLNDVNFQGTLNSTSTYQTVTTNLGAMTNTLAGTFDLGDFTTGTRQFRIAFLGLNGKFDTDTNNTYYVDNIRLNEVVAVPEPSSLGMLAIGMLGGVTYWRKRRSSKS